ncbi:rhamnogalacturonan acetylesterase [Streptomyces sp. N2-109]|uniref:Rhamnogalacturonan acetylesterase n=1 Tax=Streptomyces gossypii TaxID=2883101 RepID=A0ABT2JUQ2_9ACTN|nr:rhamnogalacturonan acetylesterase [Streptomyces gossypii]MCT2591556.1 rhamnogalacturonan acetylesterase [Streptomyces gossypii]
MVSASAFRRGAVGTALLSAAFSSVLTGPAQADSGNRPGLPEECRGSAPVVCHFDVPPGDYQVKALIGGKTAGSTGISAEMYRGMLAETPTEAGQRLRRSFTVNVREPEGQPTKNEEGGPGLELRFEGKAPRLSELHVTPARKVPRLFLIGDSTVCDQGGDGRYAGWGQHLPQFLKRGGSVANYADSGEGTGSYLAKPELFDNVESRVRRGDVVLIQLAHNDKQTTAGEYRSRLTEMAERISAKGGRPVFVTPTVRRWFNDDGTLQPTGLHVTGQANLPDEMRSLADDLDLPVIDLTALTQQVVESLGEQASKDLYVEGDSTHTDPGGATEFAALVAEELRSQRLLPARLFR